MAKTKENVSATQKLRVAIPKILQEKFKDGASFEALWDELAKDKELKKVMYTKENQARTGLLQGLTNRIKSNKEENIAIIKQDGKNVYIYCNNSIQKLVILTQSYLESVETIDTTTDTNLTKEKELLLKEHKETLAKLTKVISKLNGTK